MGAKSKLIGFIAFTFFVSSTFLLANSEKVYTGLTDQPQLEVTPMPEIIKPERPELKLEASKKVKVDKFLISGNVNISTDELLASISKYKGKELSVPQLLELADILTRKYWEKGYVTSFAYIPVQKMERGILEIEVVEGRPGKIYVQNNRYYTTKFIGNHLSYILDTELLDSRDLERGLLLLNDYPKLNVKATLTKGDLPGTTDILLDTYEPCYPMNFGLFFNNFGSRYTGQNRAGFSWDWANLTKHGDILSLMMLTNPGDIDQLLYWKLGYSVPIGYNGTKLDFAYSRMDYEIGKELSILGIEGKSEIIGFGVSHPLIRAREKNLQWYAGLKKKTFENFLFEKLYNTSTDEYAVLEAGLKGDKVVGRNHTYMTFNTTTSLGKMFGGMSDIDYTSGSRPGITDSSWMKFNLDLTNITKFGNCQLITKGSGQVSTDCLLTGEQFVIGGPDSVRGYPSGEFLGDHGYFVSAELRTPFLPGNNMLNKYINWAFFVDHGTTYYKKILPGEEKESSLTGMGLGVRVYIPCHFHLRFDAAWPKTDNASDGNDRRYWLQAGLNF